MYTSLLDLSNHARAATSAGDIALRNEAVTEVKNRLQLPRGSIDGELHGRKAVDAMLNLALAGESESWIYETLCDHAEAEVRRWGRRRSCTSMTIAQLAERTAAAGCRGPLGLYDALGDVLVERAEPTYATIAASLSSGAFSIASSPQAARWVFRASSRQGKVASESADGFGATDWDGTNAASSGLGFADSSRPLTLDLGCGFGVGPLIYANDGTLPRDENLLGCDLSASAIGYGRGVASRWGVGGRCRFARADARATLRAARDHYPGGLHRVILSCPTPYAQLDAGSGAAEGEEGGEGGAGGEGGDAADEDASGARLASGNSQLPMSASDPCFLGHDDVFSDVSDAIHPGGLLYLASNVEDVAVTLKHKAERHGFETLTTPPPEAAMATCDDDEHSRAPLSSHAMSGHGSGDALDAPLRQQRWHTLGGERAAGACWHAARRPMPWASETERTHQLEGRAVHRVVCRKL